MTDVAYQLNNWYHFLWLCGDHIVEQHVHNLDVVNWAMNGHPLGATGPAGGRPATPRRPSGAARGGRPHLRPLLDRLRLPERRAHVQLLPAHPGVYPERFRGRWSARMARACHTSTRFDGKRVLSRDQDRASVDPYVQEHTDLIECIREDKPINELKQVAESTLTAIMGRMSAYTGQAGEVGTGTELEGRHLPGEPDLGHEPAGGPWCRTRDRRNWFDVRRVR